MKNKIISKIINYLLFILGVILLNVISLTKIIVCIALIILVSPITIPLNIAVFTFKNQLKKL